MTQKDQICFGPIRETRTEGENVTYTRYKIPVLILGERKGDVAAFLFESAVGGSLVLEFATPPGVGERIHDAKEIKFKAGGAPDRNKVVSIAHAYAFEAITEVLENRDVGVEYVDQPTTALESGERERRRTILFDGIAVGVRITKWTQIEIEKILCDQLDKTTVVCPGLAPKKKSFLGDSGLIEATGYVEDLYRTYIQQNR